MRVNARRHILRGALVVAGLSAAALSAVVAAPLATAGAPRPVASSARATVLQSQTLPRLLTIDFSTNFRVRPRRIVPTGDGSDVIGRLNTGKGHAIQWSVWSALRARGSGTFWIDDGIPNVALGTFHAHPATILAFRVRHGRFTRMTVRFHGGDKVWNSGSTLYVFKYSLQHGGSGYIWSE